MAINSTHIVLAANDEQTIYPITYNEYNTSATSFPTTYIGGSPNDARTLTHGNLPFVGCIEDVIINTNWILQMNSHLASPKAAKPSFNSVESGCHREPQCNPNPCGSGGHCADKWRDFSCSCERPFIGRTCQYSK